MYTDNTSFEFELDDYSIIFDYRLKKIELMDGNEIVKSVDISEVKFGDNYLIIPDICDINGMNCNKKNKKRLAAMAGFFKTGKIILNMKVMFLIDKFISVSVYISYNQIMATIKLHTDPDIIYIPVMLLGFMLRQHSNKELDQFLNMVMEMVATDISPSIYGIKMTKDALLPKRATNGSAGYDIYALEDVIVKAHDKALISTGVIIIVPNGFYGRIASRSSLAVKNFIDVGAGVIDSDYRNELKVLLFNHSDKDFKVNATDRIAQLLVEKINTSDIIELNKIPKSLQHEGFGSTGK